MSENEAERKKKMIDWMKQNVEPYVRSLNAIAERETKEIYIGSRDLLAATLIGVFIGVLTNVSAEYLIIGELSVGLAIIAVSVLFVLVYFYLWRFFLRRDLQKYIEKLFYEGFKLLKEKSEKDFGISSSEEKSS